ncbi:MAG: ATPase, T2SS/T4P/T4SS family [Planctomycetota bacterium]
MRFWLRRFLLIFLATLLLVSAPSPGCAQPVEGNFSAQPSGGETTEDAGGGADDPGAADSDASSGDASSGDASSGDGPTTPAASKRTDKWNDTYSIYREKKGHASWLYPPLIILAFLIWVRTGDWINRDAQVYELGHETWNPIVLLAGLGAFLTTLFLPFAAVLPLMLLASFVPLVAYAIKHNQSVESHQKVFTKDWLRWELAKVGAMVGMKVETEKPADYAKGAAVEFSARGGGDVTKDKANLLKARQSPGFVLAKELVAQMVRRRSERVLLDFRADSVGVRHYIDGVWHNGEAVAREDGDVMLAVVKQMANLNPAERRAKQAGEIGAKYQGGVYDLEVSTQGVKTGERAVVAMRDTKQKSLASFADLGMRDKISAQWGEALGAESGLLVASAEPGAGVTTLVDVSLMETDRLMRDFFSIEDAGAPERDIENIVVHTYEGSKGQTAASILEKLGRLYPNAYVCRDISDPATSKGLIGEAKDEGRLVLTSVAAREAPEALLRLLKNKAPHRDLVETVAASINMRLIRLLCDACKVAYEPSPELLKKLGIPAGKVTALYRVPNEEEVKKPCEKCGGVGYYGRTGLFELLIVDDGVRQVLLKQPKMETLRKAARAAGMRNHQEEGILLVAKGATSLQELQRVLKG